MAAKVIAPATWKTCQLLGPLAPRPRGAYTITSVIVSRDPQLRSIRTLEHVLGDDPAVLRGFAKAAHDALANGPLTLDGRQRLLARGERLGIRRFDANLILAAVEQKQSISPDRWRPVAPVPADAKPWFVRCLMAALGVQAAIVMGAWWLFVR